MRSAEGGAGAKLRAEILAAVRRFYEEAHRPPAFVPGESFIHYAGRVYDAEELVGLVDASLDFWLTAGPRAAEFESRLAQWLGARFALLVNSGSSANLLAVTALTSPLLDRPLRPGDEVLTPALTFPTTLAPIVQNGLVPVFVDIDPKTLNAEPGAAAAAVSEKTRALVLPHTLGNPFDLRAFAKLARDRGLFLVEDACDALGAEFDGKKVGGFGDTATASFFPAHHMTVGEGGAVFTGDGTIRRALASLRDWGRDCWCAPGDSNTCGKRFGWKLGDLPEGYDHKYIFSHIGYNLKALELQAAIGLAQLEKLPGFIAARRANFRRLQEGLAPHAGRLLLPESYPGANPSWFALPVTVAADAGFTRAELVAFLESRKIETRMIFAGNILKQPAYRGIPHRVAGALTHTDAVMERAFFVGVYPGLSEGAIGYILEAFRDFLKKR